MSKTSPPSSLAERIRLHVPTRWAALTQADLYYYFALVAACPDENAERIKAQFLLRRCVPAPAHVVFSRLHPAALLGAMECLDFFDRIPDRPVRIERIGRARAVAPDLVDCDFCLQDYLTCENLYTAALAGGRDEALRQMCKILYRTPAGEYAINIRPRPVTNSRLDRRRHHKRSHRAQQRRTPRLDRTQRQSPRSPRTARTH